MFNETIKQSGFTQEEGIERSLWKQCLTKLCWLTEIFEKGWYNASVPVAFNMGDVESGNQENGAAVQIQNQVENKDEFYRES